MSDDFALDRSLLNPDYPVHQWGNLGLWDGAAGYVAACEALAVRLGEAAGLAPGQRVLDVGFGHGDQLRVWKERFAVGPLTGVEVDPRGLAAARRRLADHPDVTLGTGWDDAGYDAALALDCAYHFPGRAAFYGRLRAALRPGGVLALTDVVLARDPGPLVARIARACAIPPENLMTAAAYQRQLEALGFVDVRVEPLPGVLDGFARRAPRLVRLRPSAGVARILVTALAARWLTRRDAVRYALITARSSASSVAR